MRGETRHIELWTRIATLRAEVDAIETTLGEGHGEARGRIRIVRSLLTDASSHLDDGRIEEAWGQYHGAARHVVFVYGAVGDEKTLSVRARAIYEEAHDALSGAPRRTVRALLTDGTRLASPPEPTALAEAMRVLHDQYERVALTRRYLQSQFNQLLLQGTLSLVLILCLAAAAALLSLGDSLPLLLSPLTFLVDARILVSPLNPQAALASEAVVDPSSEIERVKNLQTVGFALYVVLVGVLGASVFGMRTLRDHPLSTQAVRRTPGLFVTGARAFIGATSALFLVFVLFTGVVSNEAILTAPLALAVAFAAGYSERLAPQAVDAVSQVVPAQADRADARPTHRATPEESGADDTDT